MITVAFVKAKDLLLEYVSGSGRKVKWHVKCFISETSPSQALGGEAGEYSYHALFTRLHAAC